MTVPITVAHLFEPLDQFLIELLESLSPDEWAKPTVAKKWTVKDVASHLLDGNIRALSVQRDRFFGDAPPHINGYNDLVAWLNQLNHDWVTATKRLSPEVLILLHKATGPLTSSYFASLNPWDEALFAVSWAGQSTSYNWMHVAREYTEKWHHQQQIRDATGKQGIMGEEFFLPLIDTYFKALPFAFRDTDAPEGTVVSCHITGHINKVWYLERQKDGWQIVQNPGNKPATVVAVDPDTAWKLFSKNIRPYEIGPKVKVTGDLSLAESVLNMVSVMA